MKWFENLSVRGKLMAGFVIVAAIAAVVGWLGLSGADNMSRQAEAMYADRAVPLRDLGYANAALLITRINLYEMMATTDLAERRELASVIDEESAKCDDYMAGYEKTKLAEEEQQTLPKFLEPWERYKKLRAQGLALALEGKDAQANAVFAGEARQMQADARTNLRKLIDINARTAEETNTNIQDEAAAARTQMLTVIGVGLLLAVGLGFLLSRQIAGALMETVRVLEAVAQGDFTKKLDRTSKDEIGRMARALNTAVERMRAALAEIRDRASEVAAVSEQLASASEQLSSGAQEQASSLEETSANLEEMTATVKQNADSAQQANQLASGSRDSAEKGGQVVGNAVGAMKEINDSSKRIADIITTIDEIAFQTNLLALNAAVEAARAGEQGRGFAVVAAEVRNLAQRSATAAKEIKALIQDSVRKVEGGTELVNKSGQTLEEIVTSVKRVTDIVSEIAAASAEQSTGIDQLSKAMNQMEKVTQTNSAQTEELSSTAQSLNEQSTRMQELAARFRLGEEDGAAVPARAARKQPVAGRAALRPVAAPSGETRDLVALHQSHSSDEGFEEY